MDARELKAVRAIQQCVHASRYRLTPHFIQRMHQRGLFWPDVQAALDDPETVRCQGLDRFGRPKWVVAGRDFDGWLIEVVCVLDSDEKGNHTVFITLY